jgi:hypothetical protein
MFAENLAPFFNVAEFADSATLDGVSVSGIFENGYSEVYAMTTHDARFTMAASATTAAATTASVLVVRSTNYRVRSVQDDGTGVTTLLLERS